MSLLPPKPEVIPDLKNQLPKKKKKKTSYAHAQDQIDAQVEIETKPGEYDLEKIKKWQRLGIPRPEWIPHLEWDAVRNDLKPIQGVICHLAALAMSEDDIAQITGTSPEFVKSSTKTLVGKAEIQRIQDQVWGDDFKKIIKAIIPMAIQTAFQAMVDPKTKTQTKVDAAFKFMDRAMGKPTQQIEINDNLIRSVFEKLDEQAGKVIDITQATEIALTETQATDTVIKDDHDLDAVDSWVKENL